jgi:subfamily B ATP-binding cassette protein MsbA
MMDAPVDVQDAPDAQDLPRFARELRFEGVRFGYGDLPVLHEVSLTIGAGEVHALVGPSGAGKTTLVSLVPRFYDPSGGRVTLDGIDLRQGRLRSLRDQIALVTQETVLFDETVRNNIAYGRKDIAQEEVEAAARAANAHGFIGELPEGYDTGVGESGSRLSAGQRQRLAIARALLKDAPILILDEATSALDTESEHQVQEALDRLMEGRTTLVIAHRLSTVRRATCIHVVESGRVVESGTHDELLARGGLYARLHALQFRDDGPSEAVDGVSSA